jgi:Kef-type K+ transport system membrane component KefB
MSDSPGHSATLPPCFTSGLRLCLLFVGYACMAGVSFVFGRHSLWIGVALLALSCVCTCLAHGSFREARPSRGQQALLIGGFVGVVVLAHVTGYDSLARGSSWLPLHPVFLWFALFYATVDLLKLQPGNA